VPNNDSKTKKLWYGSKGKYQILIGKLINCIPNLLPHV